jgi:hypothetical protein
MDRKDEKRSSAVWIIGTVVVLLIVLPLFYALSLGPAVYFYETGIISEETLLTLYAPIHWLAHKSKILEAFIEWYCWLWTPTRP